MHNPTEPRRHRTAAQIRRARRRRLIRKARKRAAIARANGSTTDITHSGEARDA